LPLAGSVSVDQEPLAIPGRFVNLFESDLVVHHEVKISPGSRFLVDWDELEAGCPRLLRLRARRW